MPAFGDVGSSGVGWNTICVVFTKRPNSGGYSLGRRTTGAWWVFIASAIAEVAFCVVDIVVLLVDALILRRVRAERARRLPFYPHRDPPRWRDRMRVDAQVHDDGPHAGPRALPPRGRGLRGEGRRPEYGGVQGRRPRSAGQPQRRRPHLALRRRGGRHREAVCPHARDRRRGGDLRPAAPLALRLVA